MHGKYILHVVSWYPHQESPFEGDFIERHIRCISRKVPSIVYFAKAVTKPRNALIISNSKNCKIYKRLFQRAGAISNYSKYHAHSGSDIKEIINDHGKPLAIHCHASYPGLSVSSALASCHNIPLILTEHSTIYQQENLKVKDKLILQYIKNYIRKPDVICPVSLAHQESILQKCKVKKSVIIPNVVPNSFFDTLLKKSKNPFKLLHISSLDDEQKNITDILRGFSILQSIKPEVSLTLAGNSNIKLVKRISKKLKISLSNIRIIGPLDHYEIPKLMIDHDLFVLWSRYESFSLVIAEAFASGLPVISNDSGGITSEINNNLGHLAAEYTPEGLAKSISATLDRYHEIDITYLRKYAMEKYSEISIATKYEQLYKSLVLF